MLKETEIEELKTSFRDELNYARVNPLTLIDPLSYHTPEGNSCLHIAAIRGDYRAAELLIKAGLNIDEVGDMGSTPLHYAIQFGHIDVVDILIAHGASVDIKNEFERTPVELAKAKGISLAGRKSKV